MSGREISMLDSAVMRKNSYDGELKNVIGVYSNNFYYVCQNLDWGEYKVLERVDSEFDYEIIKTYEGVLNNEKHIIGARNAYENISRILQIRRSGQGRINLYSTDAESGKSNINDDRFHRKSRRLEESDGFRITGRSIENFKGDETKYSIKLKNTDSAGRLFRLTMNYLMLLQT